MNNNGPVRRPRAARRPQNMRNGTSAPARSVSGRATGAHVSRNTDASGRNVRTASTQRARVIMGTGGRRLLDKNRASSGGAVVPRRESRALAVARKETEWQNEVERVRGGVDKLMLAIIVVLLAFGALMVYSASYPTAIDKFGDSFYYLKKHLIFMLIGGALMLVTTIVPYTWYKKWGVLRRMCLRSLCLLLFFLSVLPRVKLKDGYISAVSQYSRRRS